MKLVESVSISERFHGVSLKVTFPKCGSVEWWMPSKEHAVAIAALLETLTKEDESRG